MKNTAEREWRVTNPRKEVRDCKSRTITITDCRSRTITFPWTIVRAFFCFALVLAAAVTAQAADDELIWRIGVKDNNYAEFAIAGDHGAYPKRFPNGVTYEIGKSNPSTDWPYIQPGPVDQPIWLGGAETKRTITFDIPDEPTGTYLLEIDLVDGHGSYAPTVSVALNSREQASMLAAGAGDASLWDPTKGRQQIISLYVDGRYLRKGANTVTIKSDDGSWFLYDAVSLSKVTNPPPDLVSMTATPTCLFKSVRGNPRQVVRASVDLFRDCDLVRLRLKREKGGQVEQTYRSVPSGRRDLEILIPPVKSRERVHVTAYVGRDRFEAECVVEPAKLWRVYLLPSTHFDLGYTGPQDSVLELHRGNMDRALDWAKRYPGFVWDLEGSYLAFDYVARGSRPQEFLAAAKRGAIGVQGFLGSELTGICSSEGLSRLLDYYDFLRKKHGIASGCVMETDVPSMVATVPMILRGHGINYISHGINATRARGDQAPLSTPHWWQSPDGSRVLMWKTGGYGWVSQITQMGDRGSLRTAEQRLSSMLDGYARRPDYPFDAILLHGAYGDNCPSGESLAQVVADWNNTYAYPKLIFCRGSEFFEHIERNFAKDLKTVTGDGGVWWEDGAGSSAFETATVRQAERDLVAAEKLTSLCSLKFQRRVKPLFEEAWRNALLYNEHTWGAAQSISEPESTATLEQWRVKKRFADMAGELARELLEAASQESGRHIAGAEAPLAPTGDGEPVLDNRFYRVRIDPATGAVVSIFDKQLGRELVAESGYGANQYLYVTGGGGSVEGMGQLRTDLKIGVCASAVVTRYASDARQVADITCQTSAGEGLTTRIVLWNDRRRIDFENHLDKKATTAKEAGYFAFPFAFAKPQIRLEIPNGVIRPDADQFNAACRDWYAVQDFLTVSDANAEVVLVPWDSPLVTLQDINRGQWYERLPIENGNVFAYVFNNYWFTNYKASQGGPLTFRFSITSGKALKDSQAKRFAESVLSPAQVTPAKVDVGNVVVQAVKPARFAEGTIVRLREMDGKTCRARVTVSGIRFKKAFLCNLAEDKIKGLAVRNGAVEVPCRALALATVLLER